MKKNKTYWVVLGGKILEYPSIMDLRSCLEDDDWDGVMAQTLDYYLQMESVRDAKIELDKKDIRTMRHLKRTIKTMEKIDPIGFKALKPIERKQKYMKNIDKEMQTLEISFEKSKSSDICVSEL